MIVAADLAALKADALDQIHARYLTILRQYVRAGLEDEYQEKRNEALRYFADPGSPGDMPAGKDDPALYPFLADEKGITNAGNFEDAANAIMAAIAAMQPRLMAAASLRRTANFAVEAASQPSQISAAIELINQQAFDARLTP